MNPIIPTLPPLTARFLPQNIGVCYYGQRCDFIHDKEDLSEASGSPHALDQAIHVSNEGIPKCWKIIPAPNNDSNIYRSENINLAPAEADRATAAEAEGSDQWYSADSENIFKSSEASQDSEYHSEFEGYEHDCDMASGALEEEDESTPTLAKFGIRFTFH